jgi:GT2 family glycosyltransferase
MEYPKVSIIILNWNNWNDTIECIESVYRIKYSNYDVILVDNGSTNDSVKQIKQHFNELDENKLDHFISPLDGPKYMAELNLKLLSSPIENSNGKHAIFLIETNKNLGFSEGNNIGIRFCCKNLNPDYILLLNNDVIVDPDFLDELVQAGEKMHEIGFVGPKIYYFDYNGRKDVISFAGASIDLLRGWFMIFGIDQMDNGQLDDQKIVDLLQGSCILVKRKVVKDIGLLDPVYFFYWEDADWCIRGKKYNWSSLYAPAAKIWHKGGKASTGMKNTFQIFYFARNRIIFMRKNSESKKYFIFLLYYFGFEFWKLCVYYTIKGNLGSLRTYLEATAEGFTLNLNNI